MGKKTNSTRSVLMRVCLIAIIIAMMCSIVACKPDPTTPTDPTDPAYPTDVYDASFADNTWAEIADACQKNAIPDTWLIGDTKEMEIDGQSYTVAIIGKNHDTYVDGGVAPLTFQVIDLVGASKMNSTNTNAGGWTNSELRATLNSDEFLSKLPSEVIENIKAVNKVTNIGSSDIIGENMDKFVTNSEKLFLLASVEVAGAQFWDWYTDAYYDYLASLGASEDRIEGYMEIYEDFINAIKSEGTQYTYYAPSGTTTNPPAKIEDLGDNVSLNYWYSINAATLNTLGGYPDAWWLRTPGSIYADAFLAVNHCGNLSEFFIIATAELGVSFAFCF